MSHLGTDVRYALRQMRRSPGFTLTALAALALGIGANSALFTVVDAVMLRPLPFPEAGRVVSVYEDAAFIGFPKNTPAPANWVDWRRMNTVFTEVAATRFGAKTLTGGGTPEMLFGRGVTANLWKILEVQPALGRVFTEEEDQRAERVVVISHGLWQRRFGGDPGIVGSDIWLSDEKYRVIGVMPRGFFFPMRQVDIWTPAAFTSADLARRGSHFLQCYARLKAGVTLEQARADLRRIMSQLEQAYPDTNHRVGGGVEPVREQMVGSMGTALWVLLAAAGCVLLIACANIANLLLARAAARQRELAVRTALGASRVRLLMQTITESLLLSGLGALLGLGVARLSLFALGALIPESLPVRSLAIDPRALLFTFVLSVLTGLLFGAAPGAAAARTDLHDTLKQGGRGGTGLRSARLRNALVAAEVALAVLLVIGSGLLLRTLAHLQSIDPGFEPAHVLTMSTPLPRPRYQDAVKREQFFQRVLDGVQAIPGVASAAYTSNLPFSETGNTSSYFVEGQHDPEREKMQDALLRTVSNGFLQTLKARLREGRFFGAEDGLDTQPVLIINETFANAHWPGKSAIGQRVKCPAGDEGQPWRTVVGVVRDVQERGLEWKLKPAVYIPLPQARTVWNVPRDLVMRTVGEPLSLADAARRVIAAADPDQPVRGVRAMEEVTDRELATRRQQLTILGAFAGLSLLLASIGIYGVLAYVVSLRRKEMGIRMALGASGGSLAWSVMWRGLGLTLIGIAAGLAGAFALTRTMSSLLNGVQAADPMTFGAGSAVLLVVAAAACWLPARRAGGLNPVEALREE